MQAFEVSQASLAAKNFRTHILHTSQKAVHVDGTLPLASHRNESPPERVAKSSRSEKYLFLSIYE